jgi:hypothetical protein
MSGVLNLGVSITASTRMRFSVHTAGSAPDRRLATFVFAGQLGRHGLERAKARTITAIGRNRRIAQAGSETARR